MSDDTLHDWLHLVEKALTQQQLLPALEEHFPFPWEAAAKTLQEALGLPHLTLTPSRAEWREPHEFLQGMGDRPAITPLEIAPLEGNLFFILPQNDIIELTTRALTIENEKVDTLSAQLRQGFYYFLLLKALQAVDHLKILKECSLHLLATASLPQEKSFCVDIACKLASRILHGRLLCTKSFLEHLKTYTPFQKTSILTLAKTSPLELSLRCEIGHTSLSNAEWEELKIGDFLILDRCSFDPSENKGSLTLFLGETPLLMARFKPEGIKILDFAFYHETSSKNQAESGTMDLTVEVGNLTISLDRLLHLKPGEFLEFTLKPQQGVSIMHQNSPVAKAELLKLGEIPGARILSL